MKRSKRLLAGLLTTNERYYFVPVIVAAVMAYLCSRYLFAGSGLTLLPWAVLSLACGLIARSQVDAKMLGVTCGFCQAFIFLWVDHSGALTLVQFILLLLITLGLSVLAAFCAMIAAWLGYRIKPKNE